MREEPVDQPQDIRLPSINRAYLCIHEDLSTMPLNRAQQLDGFVLDTRPLRAYNTDVPPGGGIPPDTI